MNILGIPEEIKMVEFCLGERLRAGKNLNHGEAHMLGMLRNRGVLGMGGKKSKKLTTESGAAPDEGEGEDDAGGESDLSDVDDQMDQLLNADEIEAGASENESEDKVIKIHA